MRPEVGSREHYEQQRKEEAQKVIAARVMEHEQCKYDPFAVKSQKVPEPTGDKDPWKHRSTGMACATCMWYVEKVVPPVTKVGYQRIGRCRRHAPSMNGYPVVYPADWCGDHKLDEMKL